MTGMEPLNLLLRKCAEKRDFHCDTSAGTVPVNWLSEMPNAESRIQLPIVTGSVPLNLLRATSKEVRMLHCARAIQVIVVDRKGFKVRPGPDGRRQCAREKIVVDAKVH
jgi:hypothetical protein